MKSKVAGMLAMVVIMLAAASFAGAQVSPREVHELQGSLHWKTWAGIYIVEEEYGKAIDALGSYKRHALAAHDFDQAWFSDRLAEIKRLLRSDITVLEARVNEGDWSGLDTLILYQNLCRGLDERFQVTAKAETPAEPPSP